MPQLDEQIRNVVDRTVEPQDGPVTVDEAINRAGSIRTHEESPRVMLPLTASHRGRGLLAVAALILLAIGISAAFLTLRGSRSNRVATTPGDQNGFDSWGPGWHEIDRGPVPTSAVTSLAWFDERLVAVGGSVFDVTEAGGTWKGWAWAYDPNRRSWTAMPKPPMAAVTLIAAGDRLVAVGADPNRVGKPGPPVERDRWATWSFRERKWVDRGVMQSNSALAQMGIAPGISGDGSERLVWTGQSVLDMTRGTVLEPRTGKVGLVEYPQGVLTFGHLAATSPVWTGSAVVWPSPSSSGGAPGLAWGPDGQDVREIPAPLAPEGSGIDVATPSNVITVAVDGSVVLFGVGEGISEPYVQSFDPATDRWSSMPVAEQFRFAECFYGSATTTADVLLVPCYRESPARVPIVLRDRKWFDTGAMPANVPAGPDKLWISLTPAGRSIVVWSRQGYMANPDESVRSGQWAAVWVPERTDDLKPPTAESPNSMVTTTATATTMPGKSVPDDAIPPATSPAQCAAEMSTLPDITGLLPPIFNIGPEPGAGGMPGVEGPCTRYWGVSTDPGVHVTQGPGSSTYRGPEKGSSGDYVWSEIEDGWTIEYHGRGPCYLQIYGVTEASVKALFERLAKM